jgi:adenine deaminase
MVMFGSDDKHPDELVSGHINLLCKRAVKNGMDVFNVLKAACINPVEHYSLETGQLRIDDSADFILVNNLTDFSVMATYMAGNKLAEQGQSLIPFTEGEIHLNKFDCSIKTLADLECKINGAYTLPVIEALDGQLITNKTLAQPLAENGCWVSDVEADILKIVVINRYYNAPAAIAFIKNFGLKQGAIASSVAHDSHNIVAVVLMMKAS